MTTIFYLFSIIFLWNELIWLVSPIEKTKDSRNFLYLKELNKGKKYNDYSEEYKKILKSKIPQLIILLWFFMGLFTFQWAIFLLIIIFNFIIIAPISNIVKYNYLYTIIHWFNSLIGFCFVSFVIVNKHHLQIDISGLIIKYFQSIL